MNVTCLTCGMNNKIRSLTFNLICNIGNNKLNVISFKKNAKLFLGSLSVSYKRKELDVIVIKVISCEKCEDKIITDKSSCTGYKNGFTVLVQAYKRSAHGDGSVIYDIVVIVGFSSACAISEIGFRASDGNGFQKGIKSNRKKQHN